MVRIFQKNLYLSLCRLIYDISESIPLAIYAFMGVEVVAITAYEAKSPRELKTLQGPSKWMPVIISIIYIFSLLLVSLNVSWTDPMLPHLKSFSAPQGNQTTGPPGNSAFLIAMYNANAGRGLPVTFSVLLCIGILSTANMCLYVSSRTLYGLTRDLPRSRWLSHFGSLNTRRVPRNALIASCIFYALVVGLWLGKAHGHVNDVWIPLKS
jgi:amino acid transporter